MTAQEEYIDIIQYNDYRQKIKKIAESNKAGVYAFMNACMRNPENYYYKSYNFEYDGKTVLEFGLIKHDSLCYYLIIKDYSLIEEYKVVQRYVRKNYPKALLNFGPTEANSVALMILSAFNYYLKIPQLFLFNDIPFKLTENIYRDDSANIDCTNFVIMIDATQPFISLAINHDGKYFIPII